MSEIKKKKVNTRRIFAIVLLIGCLAMFISSIIFYI